VTSEGPRRWVRSSVTMIGAGGAAPLSRPMVATKWPRVSTPVPQTSPSPIVECVSPALSSAPATPTELVATMLENSGTPPAVEVDLSWSISTESDLAGYRIYRSERENEKGELLTQDLLLSPAYRDTSVQSGHRYWYSVTAVDRSSNESAPTPQVAADVAQHTP